MSTMSKSPITTETARDDNDLLPLVHPGEILLEEFLKPMHLSQYRLAQDIHVPPRRINEIVHGKRAITADTALRLARYFGMAAEFWMGLQMDYELRREERLPERLVIESIQPLVAAS